MQDIPNTAYNIWNMISFILNKLSCVNNLYVSQYLPTTARKSKQNLRFPFPAASPSVFQVSAELNPT